MSLRTSARTPVRGRGRVVRRGARGGTSGWAIGSRVVPATAVPEELVNQVSCLLVCVLLILDQYYFEAALFMVIAMQFGRHFFALIVA